MRKLFWKLMDLYRAYRMFMWLGGVLVAVGLPLLNYGLHAFNTVSEKRRMGADDPESVRYVSVGDPWTWASGKGGPFGRLTIILCAVGVLALLVFLVFQIVAWVAHRTSFDTGGDHLPDTGEGKPTSDGYMVAEDDDYGDGYDDDEDGMSGGYRPSGAKADAHARTMAEHDAVEPEPSDGWGVSDDGADGWGIPDADGKDGWSAPLTDRD